MATEKQSNSTDYSDELAEKLEEVKEATSDLEKAENSNEPTEPPPKTDRSVSHADYRLQREQLRSRMDRSLRAPEGREQFSGGDREQSGESDSESTKERLTDLPEREAFPTARDEESYRYLDRVTDPEGGPAHGVELSEVA